MPWGSWSPHCRALSQLCASRLQLPEPRVPWSSEPTSREPQLEKARERRNDLLQELRCPGA